MHHIVLQKKAWGFSSQQTNCIKNMTAHLDKARECQCSRSRLHFNPLPVSGISALCCDWTVSVKRFKSRLNYTPRNWPNLELHSLFLIISSVWSYRWALTVCVYVCLEHLPVLTLSTWTARWHFKAVTADCQVPFQRLWLSTEQVPPLPESKGQNFGIPTAECE